MEKEASDGNCRGPRATGSEEVGNPGETMITGVILQSSVLRLHSPSNVAFLLPDTGTSLSLLKLDCHLASFGE